MNLFDILGPVMVGPSSSHTAGAVRIGLAARALLGRGTPRRAHIALCGSFAATGRGHGTPRALIAGLLGFAPDDERIPDSPRLAREAGMDVTFGEEPLRGEHPNTARLHVEAADGETLDMTASSLGGGRIEVVEMNGLSVLFSGELPTLIVQNRDQPGCVSDVTGILAGEDVNIATMRLYRDHPGGSAVMVLEIDKPVAAEGLARLRAIEGVFSVAYLDARRAL